MNIKDLSLYCSGGVFTFLPYLCYIFIESISANFVLQLYAILSFAAFIWALSTQRESNKIKVAFAEREQKLLQAQAQSQAYTHIISYNEDKHQEKINAMKKEYSEAISAKNDYLKKLIYKIKSDEECITSLNNKLQPLSDELNRLKKAFPRLRQEKSQLKDTIKNLKLLITSQSPNNPP